MSQSDVRVKPWSEKHDCKQTKKKKKKKHDDVEAVIQAADPDSPSQWKITCSFLTQ